VPADATAAVERLLRQHGVGDAHGKLIVMAPGTIWETKHWKRERFAAVARHFLAKGDRVVLIGSAADQPVCRHVAAAAPGAVDLSGCTTVAELAAMLAGAAVCIANDSGAMHLAVALDRPAVAIYGPTDAVWIGPYQHPEAVLKADLPCAPCYFRRLRQCPNDHACMEAITIEAVIERAEQVLADRADRRNSAQPAHACLSPGKASQAQRMNDRPGGPAKQAP
jgi:lipopolysaccharide heptosyltransferase II